MKLYRTTGYTPLLTYFVAEDDADALAKAEVALWEDLDAIPDETVVVRTIRPPRSLEELDSDKWRTKIPLFIPDDGQELTCEELLLQLQEQKEAEEAARQVTFFFYDEDWKTDP
jgi:hypothetical protein